MRLNTGMKITLVAATVALSGLGLGLTGGLDADAGAADVASRPVVAIDQADLHPRIDHKDVNCPNDDGAGTVEPTSGRGV